VVPRRQHNLECIKPPLSYEARIPDAVSVISAAASPQHRLPPPKASADAPVRSLQSPSGPERALPLDTSNSAEDATDRRSSGVSTLEVYIGPLEFESFGFGSPGLFETSGFRIMLQTGGRAPIRWSEDQPATGQRELKYSKDVASDGRYSARLSCDFYEELSVQLPPGPVPEMLCVDVWLESRTFVERLDSLLDMVGLGSNMPEFDRRFLGRVAVSIPPADVEVARQNYPVQVSHICDGPRPKTLSIGMRWPPATK